MKNWVFIFRLFIIIQDHMKLLRKLESKVSMRIVLWIRQYDAFAVFRDNWRPSAQLFLWGPLFAITVIFFLILCDHDANCSYANLSCVWVYILKCLDHNCFWSSFTCLCFVEKESQCSHCFRAQQAPLRMRNWHNRSWCHNSVQRFIHHQASPPTTSSACALSSDHHKQQQHHEQQQQ